MWALGVLTSPYPSQKSKYNLYSDPVFTVPHLQSQPTADGLIHCSMYLSKKKSTYKWILRVQTHVVQGLTVPTFTGLNYIY